MNIIIAGGGKVGELLSIELVNEGNTVTLIDQNQKKLEKLVNQNDISGVIGNCVNHDTLTEARAEAADIFISVTSEDEINIISCIVAQKLGAKYTIARVRNPEYASHISFMHDQLGITMMINPEKEAAEDIMRVIKQPEALSIEDFAEGRVNIAEIYIRKNSPLENVKINEFRQKFGNILVTAIMRKGETIIPKGNTVIQQGDEIFVVGSKVDLTKFYDIISHHTKKIQSALIIGGGRISHYVIELLLDSGVKVKVVEEDYDTAKALSEEFPKCIVIEGDGSDQALLIEERIESYDAVISLTGLDEANILMSMFALTLNPEKVITKINNTDLLKIMDNIGLQTIVTPKRLIAYKIIKFVRSLKYSRQSSFENFFRVANNSAEALQFKVGSESKVINTPLIDLKLKENILVAYIVRGSELIFPNGSDMIKPNDEVIIITTTRSFDTIDDILE